MWLFYGNQPKAATRKYGWDYQNEKVVTEEEVPFKVMRYHPNLESIKEVDLRPQFPVEPYDQGALGSCTSQAWTGLFEFLAHKQKDPYVAMSRLGFYYEEREKMGTVDQDSGAQISTGASVIKDSGIGLESLLPYDITKFSEKPSETYYDDMKYHKAVKVERVKKTVKDITQSLMDGYPVVCGIMIYESFESEQSMKTGVVPDPDTKKEKLLGGHAILMVGCKMINNKPYFICRNSWGTSVQDQGYFYLSENFVMGNAGMFGRQELCSDLWTIKLVHDDTTDPNSPETDDQKLLHIKKILGVESSENNLEALYDGIRKLVVNVESKNSKSTESV